MITGRWAFAGQVNSSLGELDDRVRFARSAPPTNVNEIARLDRRITKAPFVIVLFAARWPQTIIARESSILFAQSRRAWLGTFLPIPHTRCLSISSLE